MTPVPPPSPAPLHPPLAPLARKPGWRFLWSHPAHMLALGFGSGLSPLAPGTVGTLAHLRSSSTSASRHSKSTLPFSR